jgi:hypothetical protein|tara:strand:- start:96 stop:281 length:186 start_codon:yes stop_codon:yes gene_type:complete
MDPIGQPVSVNRKFVKFIKEEIMPEYTKVLDKFYTQLIQELDKKYLNVDSSYSTYNGSDRD